MEFSEALVLRLYTEKCILLKGKEEELAVDKQKVALEETFAYLLTEFPLIEPSDIWKSLNAAHIQYKSGLGASISIVQLNSAISAQQSWNKTSGHAFEAFLKNRLNLALSNKGILIYLQKDLDHVMNDLQNSSRDIKKIQNWRDQSSFDLFAYSTIDKKIFGCIQAKTSIRDRVTRDREPSLAARQGYFWSIAIVLDGDFLNLPKFQAMVNGGSEEYPINGWHGAYVFGSITPNDRIYHVDRGWSLLVNHALNALKQFQLERQEFDSDWRADLL